MLGSIIFGGIVMQPELLMNSLTELLLNVSEPGLFAFFCLPFALCLLANCLIFFIICALFFPFSCLLFPWIIINKVGIIHHCPSQECKQTQVKTHQAASKKSHKASKTNAVVKSFPQQDMQAKTRQYWNHFSSKVCK